MARHSRLHKLIRHDRWWFVVWTGWGVIVAGIVFGIDRSAGALLWIAAGLVAGVFGQALFEGVFPRLCMRSNLLNSPHLDQVMSDESAFENPVLWWTTNSHLTLVNPCRKPWEVYPGIAIAVGCFHGALGGAVYGALLPVTSELKLSSFQGAWQGLLGGALFLSVLYALVMPVVFFSTHRGPSIEPIGDTVWQAARQADQLGHDEVTYVHMLLAILHKPTGLAADFFPVMKTTCAGALITCDISWPKSYRR